MIEEAPTPTVTTTVRPDPGAIRALLGMGSCYWAAALLTAAVAYLAIAVPTALVVTPAFGRSIAPRAVDHVIAVASALLIGMIWAARRAPATDTGTTAEAIEAGDQVARRRSLFAGLLAGLAVGCPVCNKVVLVALGTSGALSWWGPVQPLLGLAAIVMLGFVLRSQLRRVGAVSCSLPQVGQPGA
ncbi:MAG: hypothetical protein MUE36_04685 [Acidimicrobiales bacterium]|nr:hypothetical protein [Acidimicrobiales bacterium]